MPMLVQTAPNFHGGSGIEFTAVLLDKLGRVEHRVLVDEVCKKNVYGLKCRLSSLTIDVDIYFIYYLFNYT